MQARWPSTGSAQEKARNMVFLTMGTGFGAGIIVDGRIYQGANGNAGEIGHVRLTADGPIGYHKAGSAEGRVSGGGLAQWAAKAIGAAREAGESSLLLDLPPDHRATARDVGLAADKNDALACRIVTQLGQKLGHALAILVDIPNPERIVIGGLAMRLGERLLEPARQALAENDVLLFNGGTSVGVKDVVAPVIDRLGKPGVGERAARAVLKVAGADKMVGTQ